MLSGAVEVGLTDYRKGPPLVSFGRLKWDFLAYGSAISLDRLSGFLLLPILAGAWSPETFAAWTQILVLSALFSNVLLVGFYHSIVRYISGVERGTIAKIFRGMLGIALANCALFIVVVALSSGYLSMAVFASPRLQDLVLPGAVFIVSECIFEFVVLGFLRADGKIVVCSSYYAAKNVARLVLLDHLAVQGIALSLTALVFVNATLTCIVYLLHIAPSLPSSSQRLEHGFWRQALGFSLVIVVSSNFVWANTSLNRFLIVHVLGLAELSVYAVNYSIASIAHVVAMIVSFIFIPRVNAAWNLGDGVGVRRLLRTATEYYIFGVLPIGLAIGLFYPHVLGLLALTRYGSGRTLVATLVCFMILLGFEQILTFATLIKGSRFSLGVRALALGINVLLNLLLMKDVGLVGSVVAGNVAIATAILLNAWRLRALTGYVFPWRVAGEMSLAGLAMLAAGIMVTSRLPTVRIPALLVGGVVCGAVYLGAESLRAGSVCRALIGALFLRRATATPSGADDTEVRLARNLVP